MKHGKSQYLSAALVGLVYLSCMPFISQASAQSYSDLNRFLTLPEGTRKPEPPHSRKELLTKPAKDGVVLEAILREDGSIYAFESRSMEDATTGKVKAKVYPGRNEIRPLLRYAASLRKKKKISHDDIEIEVPDVDLLLYVSGKTRLKKFEDLLFIACEQGTAISRFHIAVKDEKSGDMGYLPYYLPLDVGSREDPKEKAARVPAYTLTMYSKEGKGLLYSIREEKGSFKKEAESLGAMENEIDALIEQDPNIVLHAGLGWIEEEETDSKHPTMQDFVDFLTLAASKGADLQRERISVHQVRKKAADEDG